MHLLESADLENMSNHQLIELISQDRLPREFKILIKSEGGSKERKNDIKKLKEELSDDTKTDEEKKRNSTTRLTSLNKMNSIKKLNKRKKPLILLMAKMKNQLKLIGIIFQSLRYKN